MMTTIMMTGIGLGPKGRYIAMKSAGRNVHVR